MLRPSPCGKSKHTRGACVAFTLALASLGAIAQYIRSAPDPSTAQGLQLGYELAAAADAHPYTRCISDEAKVRGTGWEPAAEILGDIREVAGVQGATGKQEFVEVLLKNAPCWGMNNCCEHNAYFRASGADNAAFRKFFQAHHLRTLYPIFSHYTPKYVLDAGPGSGFSTQLLKLALPNSVLVAVEPDALSYEALAMNIREIDGVHAVRGGLWSRRTALHQHTAKKAGLAAKFLSERRVVGKAGKAGASSPVQGYGVADLIAMYDLPGFDLVYLDVEGAESVVLGHHADRSWLRDAKVVAVRLHEPLYRPLYRLSKVASQLVADARGLGFTVIQDAHHIVLLSAEVAALTTAGLQAAEGEGEGDESEEGEVFVLESLADE